jgi:hypothetical protein
MKFKFPRVQIITLALCFGAITPATANIIISQYYEGSGFNKYIELHNPTNAAILLDNYHVALYSNGNREGWKTSQAPSVDYPFATGISIPAGGYYLMAHTTATAPSYANIATNLRPTVPGQSGVNDVINFNGDDSVVLYKAAGVDTANITDAFSVFATSTSALGNATDKSYYRISNAAGYDLTGGTSSNVTYASVWGLKTNAEVDNAAITDLWRLTGLSSGTAPTLLTFTLGAGADISAVPLVTINYTTSGDNPTEVMISEDAAFTGATWVGVGTAASRSFSLSAGNAIKTVYFKVKNTNGESTPLSDTIERVDYTYPAPSALITQYYEGTSNNKYIEISNLTNAELPLTNYRLVRWTNDSSEDYKITGASTGGANSTINLSTITLPPLGVVVLANTSAAVPLDANVLSLPTGLANGNINHTGNDSYALYSSATISPATLVDAVGFTTTGNEGADKTFVRLTSGQGFGFAIGNTLLNQAAVWSEVTLATVNNSVSGENTHLGTYPGGGVVGYAAWISAQFPPNSPTSITGFEQDPDGDGIKNGVEYAFVLDPNVTSASPLISGISTSPGIMTFSHKRPKLFASDVALTYQWSDNLASWANQGEYIGSNSITAGQLSVDTSNPGFDVVTVQASVAEGDISRFFIRAKVDTTTP